VIEEIIIEGNRDWNEDRRLHIPVLGLNLRWPFVDYLVTTERMLEILKEHGIEPGKVLNTAKLKEALGIGERGGCAPNPPRPSICGEYRDKGYFLFAIDLERVQLGEQLVISVIEGVIESIELKGVEEPLKGEILKMLQDIPLLRPVKLQQLQGALQRVSESVYVEPLRQQDVAFPPGSAPDRVILQLTLRERRILESPQMIERIELSGNTVFSTEELLRRLKLPEGEVDNYQLLKALQGIYRLYRKEGYMLVKFAKQKIKDGVLTLEIHEGRIAQIELRQNGYLTARLTEEGLEELPLEPKSEAPPKEAEEREGQGFLLGLIARLSEFLGSILGTAGPEGDLPRTHPEIIAKELELEPGQLANQFRLADSYRKLLGLGYFKEVNFNFQPLETGEFVLVVDVVEQEKLGSLNGSFSLSPEGLVGKLSVSGKNLYGTGQDVSLQFDRGILGKAVTNWSFDYQSRLLFEGYDYFRLKLFNNTTREREPEPYLLSRVGAEASLAYPWEEVQVVFSLRHETFTKEFEGQKEPQIERGSTNSLALTVNHDDRNNPIFATRGGIRSIRLERAGLFALGTEFTKLQATLIQHFPTFEDQNVAARLMAGLGLGLEDDPQEQFLLGGSTTLRGIDTVRTPLMAMLNLEYRIQFLPGVLSVALFLDMGSGSPFELKRSIGIEGRVTAPYIGPVRLAFAWPITDKIEYFKVEFGFGTFF
jgi:outer membrane protein insertion porin family